MADVIRIEIPIETQDNTDPELSKVTKKLEKMSSAADKAGSAASKAEKQVSKFDKNADKTQKSLAKWAKEKYEILLEAKDKISPILKTVGSGIKNIAGRAWNVTMRAIDFVTKPVQGIINILKNPIFQVGAVLGISFGLKDTIETYKNFEAAMSQVSAISGATGDDLTKLTNKAKEMGATTKFTSTEAAEAFNYMAMAGWKTGDMLNGIEGILNLAAASGEDLATTSDIVTDALTAFGLQASDASHFSDVLARASSNANTNVSMMGETFKYAGAMAGTLGYSIEDVGVMVGLMANSGIKASSAGTQLNSIFTRLSTNTGKSRDAIEGLGISFFDSTGKARDLSDVIDELRAATANYTDEQKTNLANTIAGTRAQSGLLAVLNASQEDYDKLTESINNADGASKEMAGTMQNNLSGSITLLQSAMDGVKISFGERLAPYVRNIADWLTAQMPAIEGGLSELMDAVDRGVDKIKGKYQDMTQTDEWQNADFFGKVKIAWDEMIAEPFSEWWESTGRAKMANIAEDVGGAIGSGLKFGILTLLGIDISSSVDEGASVGASFARGFSEGFDASAIVGKLQEALGNMFSNAAKIIPGGEAPDLSSFLSAGLLMKMGSPLLSMGKGAFSLGKTLFGTGAGGTSLMGSLLGSASMGTGLLGKSAMFAINMGAGNLAGGASLSTGALAGVGAAGIGGGIAAGATLISGAIDAYKAIKSDNKEEKAAYGESAGWKAGGVAAGAAAGAAIGSIIPGLGTGIGALIGAGVGGIAGWIKGNKVKEEYQENLEAAEEAAAKAQKVMDATGYSLKDVKFETEALNQAIEDSEVSADQLGLMFQEAVSDKLVSRFGDLKLSLAEIKEVASDIVFDKYTESINAFSDATADAESSLSTFKKNSQTLDKLNWKTGLGLELSESDMDGYKEAIDQYVKSAKDYVENKHYEATVAMKLLLGDDSAGYTEGLNSMYSGLQSQIDDLSGQLTAKIDIAMEDGVITLDEQAEITNLQQQITDITSKVTEAQQEAEFTSLKIRYGGAQLDAESFANLQTELQANVESMTQSYDDALEISLTNLNLQLSEGAISQEDYDAQLQALTDGYNAQIDELQVRVESFQLEAISEAFSEELDGVLPDLEGTMSEKLSAAMQNALAVNPEPATWTTEQIAGWFGLESLSAEAQTAIGELLASTAATIPARIQEEISTQSGTMDFSSVTEAIGTGVSTAIQNADMAAINGAIGVLKGNTDASVNTAFGAGVNTSMPVNVTLDYNVLNPTKTFTVSGAGGTTGSTSITVSAHAAGGYVGSPELSMLAEEGYGEYVIPTNPARRSRALDIFQEAGQALGISRYAAGGYAPGRNDALQSPFSGFSGPDYNLFNEALKNAPTGYNEAEDGNTEGSQYSPQAGSPAPQSGTSAPVGAGIKVDVHMSPEFQINSSNGTSEEDIVAIIRRHLRELSDEVGGEIASRLETVFSNMPLKEA